MTGLYFRSVPGRPTAYGGKTVRLIPYCRECGTSRDKACAFLACPIKRD